MECPKCKSRMEFEFGPSRVSGLAPEGTVATLISGHSCIICGTWIDSPISVARPVPPKEHTKQYFFKKGETAIARGETCAQAVANRMEQIKEMVKEGIGWNTIVKNLEMPMSGSTLYKYWKRAEGLR